MGASPSKYEAAMPPLPQMAPIGILPDYTIHTRPIRLEFAKSKGNISQVMEKDSGVVVFEVEGTHWGKTQLRKGRNDGGKKGKILLNIYARTFTYKWDVKGDNIQHHQARVKPLLFQIKYDSGRKPVLQIKFTKSSKEIVWLIRQDKKLKSALVTDQSGYLIAHAGLCQAKSFQKSSGIVLTVAPGIDYAMMVAAFLCRMQYQNRNATHRADNANAVAAAGINVASAVGGGGGC